MTVSFASGPKNCGEVERVEVGQQKNGEMGISAGLTERGMETGAGASPYLIAITRLANACRLRVGD